MPIYVYRCGKCGFQKEFLQRLNDAPLTDCPECGKRALGKMVTAAGFHLKGTGWYATDFKGGGVKPDANKDTPEAKKDTPEAKKDTPDTKKDTPDSKKDKPAAAAAKSAEKSGKNSSKSEPAAAQATPPRAADASTH